MSQLNQILLVDDEKDNCLALTTLLRQTGYRISAVHSGEAALELLQDQPYDLIISDLFLPGISGIDILKRVKETSPRTCFILITGNASAETAVEAMKEGAFDYITKPFNFEKLKLQVAKALEKSQLIAENIYLRQQLHGRYRFDKIIGISEPMQKVFSRMEKVAATDSTILILGASGTGKELVAKAIHYNSHRREKPFVAINCGAIPADLLESELFGHVRGAFTSANADKPGKFEVANGGTIFLDEIGNMPLQLQMKLLRVLQEYEFERVGSSRRIRLNVRLISATNVDLAAAVKKGEFREDLYYRLNVIPITLPPLNERRGDIPLLVRHFLEAICRTMNRPLMPISREALQAIEAYTWPGNVREMENVIERTVALAEGETMTLADLPSYIAHIESDSPVPSTQLPESGTHMPALIAEIEQQLILQALGRSRGVKARAAELLGINRTTLVEKMKRLKIS